MFRAHARIAGDAGAAPSGAGVRMHARGRAMPCPGSDAACRGPSHGKTSPLETRKFTYRLNEGPKGKPEMLFPTPLLNHRLAIATPDFLARIKAYVLDLMARDP